LYPLISLSPPGERIEVRGSFDKLRMTSLFAMVSSHREPDERRTITLTLTLTPFYRLTTPLSPQGRGKLR
jgi:hypothetical protein